MVIECRYHGKWGLILWEAYPSILRMKMSGKTDIPSANQKKEVIKKGNYFTSDPITDHSKVSSTVWPTPESHHMKWHI